MRIQLTLGLAVMALTVAGTSHAQVAQMRFRGLDRNNDGVITRSEWNGSDQAFRNQDWNGDGVLSGDEVRPGARRQTSWNEDWNHDGIINQQDTAIAQRFRGYDSNGDSRVAAGEWPGNAALFRQLDANRDGYLTMAEYTDNGGYASDSQGGPAYTFANLDRNRDGWITRNEWNMGDVAFNRLDVNRDNRINSIEFQGSTVPNPQDNPRFAAVDRNRDGWLTRVESGLSPAEFDRLDRNNDNRLNRDEFQATSADNWNAVFMNVPFQAIDGSRDGWVTRNEWQWDDGTFNRTDTNHDGRVSRFEFETAAGQGVTSRPNQPSQPMRTRTNQAGFDRGTDEGRSAGREDRANNHGWDLEGQTELERADSGYYSQLGALDEYQAGYREGFRQAYREGYNSR